MGKDENVMEDFSLDFSRINVTMTCLVLPPRSNSHGVFGTVTEQKNFLTYSMPLLELQMGIVLVISHLTHFLLKPLGISEFVSCLLTGIILGPCGLGKFNYMRNVIFPHDSQDILSTAAMLGFSIYIFLAGVKMELGMVFKTGRKAFSIGIISVLAPHVCLNIYRTIGLGAILPRTFTGDVSIYALVVTTSLPAVAYIIDQLNLTNTDVGRLGLASGLVGDVSGVALYSIRAFWNNKTIDDSMRKLIPFLSFILALAFIFRPAMEWFIRASPEKKPLNTSFIYSVMAFAILSEAYFFMINETRYLSVFLFGLAVPCGAPLGSALVEKFATFSVGVLLHIMVPTALMRADFSVILVDLDAFRRYLTIIFLTLSVKTISLVISAMVLKISAEKSLAITFILNYTGIVHLSIGMVVRDTRFIKEDAYAMMSLYILFNATIFPKIVEKLCHHSRSYDDCKGRNIVSLKSNNELRILTCIYGQENVESYIKLLNALHPIRESPIGVYALHLTELIGKYLPIMISHSKNKPVTTSTSQNILYSLHQYEQNNWDSVSVHLFTSFSSFPLMHHDIIDIAFEKKTSLIILPLHRRWSIHGYIESNDKRWRSVNCDVLDKAPCSVAIFFSRGRFGHKRLVNSTAPTLSVCMIFFGGNDDREALIISKQMLKDPEVTLTVIHCPPMDPKDINDHSEDYMYDRVLLDNIRSLATRNDRLDYREYVMESGAETARLLHSVANQFDLFIVGRRFGVPTPQTSGLSEWNELPELGTIGDLFASKDLKTRASVLVVQQESRFAGQL